MSTTIPEYLRRWAEKAPGEIADNLNGPERYRYWWLLYPDGSGVCGRIDMGDGGDADHAHLLVHALDCMEARGLLVRLDCIGGGLYSASALGPGGEAYHLPGFKVDAEGSSRLLAVLDLNDATLT